MSDIVSITSEEVFVDGEREALQQYREEKAYSANASVEPWWVDVGGEGDPC